MNSPLSDENELLKRLQSAVSAAAVIEILGNVSAAKGLSRHSREPGLRRAVMLLATPDPDIDAQRRLKRLAFLAAFSLEKSLRDLIDEFAIRALTEPVLEMPIGLSAIEKEMIATWIGSQKLSWIGDFAARMVIAESVDEKLCQIYLQILFSRSSDTAQVLRRLIDEIGDKGASIGVTQRRNFCVVLGRLVSKTSPPPGKNLPDAFRTFVMRKILSDDLQYSNAEKAEMAIVVSGLLVIFIHKYQGLLVSDALFEIAIVLETGWIAPVDRKWRQFKKDLFGQIEQVVTLLALSGVCATTLVRNASFLKESVEAIERACLSVLEQNDISSEEVMNWLRKGGIAAASQNSSSRHVSSDIEVISQIMLRADELIAEDSVQHPRADSGARDTLLSEINQLAARNGLQLDGQRNSIAIFDPARQRALEAVKPGGRVRILSPGVIRRTSTNQFQVVQSIVEPVEQ